MLRLYGLIYVAAAHAEFAAAGPRIASRHDANVDDALIARD